MKEKDIIEAINGIHVHPSVKTKIMALSNHKIKHKVKISLRKTVALAVVFLLVCSFSFGLPFLQNSSKPASLYEGLIIKTYAASGEEIALSPKNAIPLKEYSPFMSSVPGIPFHMGFIRMEVDEIQISVDKGTLLTWKAPNGSVEDKGNFYRCHEKDTIYWSPLMKDRTLTNQSKLTVSAFKDGNEIVKAEIVIKEIGNAKYSAELSSLISKPVKVNWEDLKNRTKD